MQREPVEPVAITAFIRQLQSAARSRDQDASGLDQMDLKWLRNERNHSLAIAWDKFDELSAQVRAGKSMIKFRHLSRAHNTAYAVELEQFCEPIARLMPFCDG